MIINEQSGGDSINHLNAKKRSLLLIFRQIRQRENVHPIHPGLVERTPVREAHAAIVLEEILGKNARLPSSSGGTRDEINLDPIIAVTNNLIVLGDRLQHFIHHTSLVAAKETAPLITIESFLAMAIQGKEDQRS